MSMAPRTLFGLFLKNFVDNKGEIKFKQKIIKNTTRKTGRAAPESGVKLGNTKCATG